MTRERVAFFVALFLCVVLVSTVTTVRVIEEAKSTREALIEKQ